MTISRDLRWILSALALVGALAVVARVVPARDVVLVDATETASGEAGPTESGVRLLGVDAYFHLRHTRYAATHFPSLLRFDPWSVYPRESRISHVGLYHLATGGVAWVLGGGSPTERRIQQVLAWTPVVVGAAVYLALFAAAAALWGPWAGLAAAVLLLAYPGTFLDRSLLGFSDHHVVEVLFVLLLLLAVARLLPGTRAGPTTPRQGALRGAVAGLLLLVFHLTWVGAPLWLVLLGPALLVGAAGAVARREAPTAAAAMASVGATFTAGFLVVSVAAPDLIQEPAVLSLVLLTGTALALLLPAGTLLAAKAAGARRASPAAAGGLLLLVGLAASALVIFFTPPGQELWALLTSVRTELVLEHIRSWRQGLPQTVSLVAWPAAAAPVVVLLRAWRTGRWTELAPLALAALGMAVAFRTGDFDYLLAPCAAFLAAAVLPEAYRLVEAGPRWARRGALAVSLAFLAAPVVGIPGIPRPWREAARIEPLRHLEEPWVDALRWLRTSTPDPRGGDGDLGAAERSPGRGPFTYGVLTAWDHGNAVVALALRPVLWSQGPSPVTAGLLFADPGEELERRWSEVGGPLRYVVVDDRTLGPWVRAKVISAGGADDRFVAEWGEVTVRGHSGMLMTFGPGFEGSLAHRLFYGDGDGLGRFRLVFQSREESITGYLATPMQPEGFEITRVRRRLETSAQRTQAREWAARPGQVVDVGDEGLLYGLRVGPAVRIYERVTGAVLAGAAPQGRRVHVAVMVQPGRDGGDRESFLWETTATVDQAGRWEVRVPYPTQPPPEEGRVGAVSAYRAFLLPEVAPSAGQLSSRDAELLADGIQVDEAQIQSGAVLRVPTRYGG